MSRVSHSVAVAVILLCLGASLAVAQISQSTFTYQGQLKDGGSGVNAPSARFDFRLWSADVGGTQIGGDYMAYPVQVTDGIFTVLLDFGLTAFDGQGRWLEIGVDTSGGTNYTWLTPRQRLTVTPYALTALTPWRINGSDLYYNAGKVGIGLSTPAYPLDVAATGANRAISGVSSDVSGTRDGVYGQSSSNSGNGVHGKATYNRGTTNGVLGEALSDEIGCGVHGVAAGTSGSTRGVFGEARSPNGAGVYAYNDAGTGNAIALYGETHNTTSGFAGYFVGNNYIEGKLGIGVLHPTLDLEVDGAIKASRIQLFTSPQAGYVLTSDATGLGSWQAPPTGSIGGSGTTNYLPKFTGTTTLGNSVVYESTLGNVGIGMTSPLYPLDVQGTVRVTGFKLASAPQDGYVLTSDAYGMGTWRAPTGGGGFTLPYSGSVTYNGPAFSITNSGTAIGTSAICGRIDNPASSSEVAAGNFSATGSNGIGVVAYSNVGPCVYAQYSGTTAYAFEGMSSNGPGGALFTSGKNGGIGVKGYASKSQGYGMGGYFASNSPEGIGVRAEVDGAATVAVDALTTSGVAVSARATEGSGIGLYAAGIGKAAVFTGNVEIFDYSTLEKVIELGKGLDYAEGFDVSKDETAVTPGTVLVIDPENPGRLARSRNPYDRKVAGIVAGANGLGSGVRLGTGQFDHSVALAGRVYCNVVALDGPIAPGDLLTTSSVPGYAMKVRDHDRAQGAILGKAMEPLAAGEKRQILVLVTLQ